MSSISDRLNQLIVQSGLKQIEFAERVGISQSVLSRWLNGKHEPNIDNLLQISDTFRIDFLWLATGRGKIDNHVSDIDQQETPINRISQSIDVLASLLNEKTPQLKENPLLVWQVTELLKTLNAALRDLINERSKGRKDDHDA